MMDIAQDRGVRIDPAVLAQKLGCPVIPLIASKGEGIEALRDMVAHAATERQVPTAIVPYRPVVEDVIHDLTTSLEATLTHTPVDARWVAVKLLEGDELAQQLAGDGLQTLLPTQIERIETVVGEDIDTIFADSRYGFVNTLTQDAVAAGTRAARNLSDKIDRVVLHRLLGIPIFLVLMYLTFMLTINVGSAFIDFFDILVSTLLVDGFRTLLTLVSSPAWLTTLLADGVGGGLQIVATFIPILGFLFLCPAVLEDSGYMARAAFVMDRFMRIVGLPGKSFVPLLIGFGCNVPAIMATRTLENRRDRLMTIAMNPFMSCGARLPVYALLAAAFFPIGAQNIVFALYLIGIAPWRSSLVWSSNTLCCRGGPRRSSWNCRPITSRPGTAWCCAPGNGSKPSCIAPGRSSCSLWCS
jgi:ferrous iron transport protein B